MKTAAATDTVQPRVNTAPTVYANPWHRANDKHSAGPLYHTEAVPQQYRGYLIYNRVPGLGGGGVWDVVKDAVCITQMAGPNGAKKAIDKLLDHAAH